MTTNRLNVFFDGRRFINGITAFLGRQFSLLQPDFVRYGPQYGPRRIADSRRKSNSCATWDPPFFSIVIPSYNQAAYLERTIESLVRQDYPTLQIIVADGGSTDGSVEILKKHADRLSWWCSEPDSGQAHGLNKGFSHADGEIMAWLNADDCLAPGTLARVAGFMAENPDVDAVYGHRILIDENDMEIGRWILPPHDDRVLSWADFVPQESLFWRRRIWEKTGGFLNECLDFAMDWDLLIRFRDAGARIVRLPFFMGHFRVHPGQKTSCWLNDVGYREMRGLRARCLGHSPSDRRVSLAVAGFLFRARVAELMWKARAVRDD